jgi:phosphoenolpyruvate---glycerone phosphotransferase subunit DhaL
MITNKTIVTWLRETARVLEENEIYLTDLDSQIGDADHGINMNRGFKKVTSQLPGVEDNDIGTIFKTTGMALISSVGGASGPLYGAFFLEAAKVTKDKFDLSNTDLVLLFAAGLGGIQRIGKARPGDKTMLDAIQPGLEALKSNSNVSTKGALKSMVEAAKVGMEKTIPMIALKGRASYLGERSIGHQDPGATSSYLMLRALLKTVEQAD